MFLIIAIAFSPIIYVILFIRNEIKTNKRREKEKQFFDKYMKDYEVKSQKLTRYAEQNPADSKNIVTPPSREALRRSEYNWRMEQLLKKIAQKS
jgi:hypothetical protein